MTHNLTHYIHIPALRLAALALLVVSLLSIGWLAHPSNDPATTTAFVPRSMIVPSPSPTVTKVRVVTKVKTVVKKVPGPTRTVYVSRSVTRKPINKKSTTKTYPAQSSNFYKSYIYMHESGNNPKRWNSSGCVGLGQACPASKLQAVCPTLSYACEDAWFSNYAISRYGSWAGAYKFWIANHWW
jgi:hypothetical protein